MCRMQYPTQERLRSLLNYDPDTGIFTWSAKRRGVKVGAECGRINGHGYREIGIDCNLLPAHRLAFIYMDDIIPENDVDHINQVKSDNRWCNLRLATRSQNTANAWQYRHRKKGPGMYVGTTYDPKRKKWLAQICVKMKSRNLGRFDTEIEAARRYNEVAEAEFGEFATLNHFGD